MEIRIESESEKEIEEIKESMRFKRENEEVEKNKKLKIEAILDEREKKEENHLCKKDLLIQQILEREEIMFKALTTLEPPISLKQLKTFRTMRTNHFSSWGNRTLKGYLVDLKNAAQAKRNLVAERYARMDDLIVARRENKLIGLIVADEKKWVLELNAKYPHVVGSVANFVSYLECELSTYSDLTLKYYFEDVKQAKIVGENLIEKRYLTMYKKLGYSTLQEAEESY